jgi:hypothetical protein
MRCSTKYTGLINNLKIKIPSASITIGNVGYATYARLNGQVNNAQKTISASLSGDCCKTANNGADCASASAPIAAKFLNLCTSPPFPICWKPCVYLMPWPLATVSAAPSLAFRSLHRLQSPLDRLHNHLLKVRFLIKMTVSTMRAPCPA